MKAFRFYMLIVLAITATSCGILRNRKALPEKLPVRLEDPGEGHVHLFRHNIADKPFWIRKIRIDWRQSDDTDRYQAYLKRNKDGFWLISLRTGGGIEGYRVLIREDSTFVLNRIQRKLMYSTTQDLLEQYGFTYEYLPVIVGDLPEVNFQSVSKEQGEAESHIQFLTGMRLDLEGKYHDSLGKLTSVKSIMKKMGMEMKLTFGEFVYYEDRNVPTRITMEIPDREIRATFLIEDLLLGESGNWGWKVKDGYERIPLK